MYQLDSLSNWTENTVEENRSSFTAPNGEDRHKYKKTHIIVKSIHSSLRSESKIGSRYSVPGTLIIICVYL